mmetsp:Transcript_18983/g.44249  ORF Transcript_18983/g.44249 Transcript_18983/m.44249 type:complete len:445 (+) Transcript_18983:135-1469(+)
MQLLRILACCLLPAFAGAAMLKSRLGVASGHIERTREDATGHGDVVAVLSLEKALLEMGELLWRQPGNESTSNSSLSPIISVKAPIEGPIGRAGRGKGWLVHEKKLTHSLAGFFEAEHWSKWLALGFISVALSAVSYWLLLIRFEFSQLSLLFWVAAAASFALCVASLMGREDAVDFVNGYMLSILFSLDNIFVFLIILKAMRCNQRQKQCAMFVFIPGQILSEFILLVGLASWLRGLSFLPYVLGVWLLAMGSQTIIEAMHEQGEAHQHTTAMAADMKKVSSTDDLEPSPEGGLMLALRSVMGKRLASTTNDSCNLVSMEDGTAKVSIYAVSLAVLLLAAFVLEIDVALTMMEEIESDYINFAASVFATFVIPPVFFLADDLFELYPMLKYGIGIVVVMAGLEQLCHRLVVIPAAFDCCMLVGVMAACIIITEIARPSCSTRA